MGLVLAEKLEYLAKLALEIAGTRLFVVCCLLFACVSDVYRSACLFSMRIGGKSRATAIMDSVSLVLFGRCEDNAHND